MKEQQHTILITFICIVLGAIILLSCLLFSGIPSKIIIAILTCIILILLTLLIIGRVRKEIFRRYQHCLKPISSDNIIGTREHLSKLLHRVSRLLEKLGIDYSITGGTLLGYTRNRGFITRDDDIDIRYKDPGFVKIKKYLKSLGEKTPSGHYIDHENKLLVGSSLSNIKISLYQPEDQNKYGIHLDLVEIDKRVPPFEPSPGLLPSKEGNVGGVKTRVPRTDEQIRSYLYDRYGKTWAIPNI